MKKLFLIATLFTTSAFASKIDRVVDGDTFIVNNPNPPIDMLQKSHRLAGVDTPESFKQVAKCQKEIELGLKAKEFVKDFTKGEVNIVYLELDKYGRYLVNVSKNGKDLAEELVKNGLAVFYDGGTKTKDWCK
jgi:micrococcal nuclease